MQVTIRVESVRLGVIALSIAWLAIGGLRLSGEEPPRGSIATAGSSETEPSPEHWGAEAHGYRLSATTEKGTLSADEPIRLRVALKNVGHATVALFNGGLLLENQIEVWFQRPRRPRTRLEACLPSEFWSPTPKVEIPLTLYGRARKASAGNESGRPVALAADTTMLLFDVNLSRLFDMTQEGDYTIVARRSVARRDGAKGVAEVIADPLVVTVVGH